MGVCIMAIIRGAKIPTLAADDHGAIAEEAIEKKIAAIFDAETRKVAREFRNMSKLLKMACENENS